MKRTLISAALAALSLGAASSAFAIQPGSALAAAQNVYVSGATAQDPGLLGLMRDQCATGTLDVYSISQHNLYACTIGGQNYAVHKESTSGSANGIGPVRAGTQLNFINKAAITTANCTSAAGTAPPSTGNAYRQWTCSVGTAAAVPGVGLSDVEPSLFGESTTGLQVRSANQLIFGIAVSTALRNALQSAQGLSAGSSTVANMPSLTESQIAAIYSGNIADGSGLGIAADTIYIARRGNTSGTQKTAEAYFLQQNLVNPPPAPFRTPDASGTNTAQFCGSAPVEVFAGSGTGDVVNCLSAHNTAGRFAIGTVSTERQQPNAGAWSYVKLNGAAPTVANAIRGTYNFYVEQAIINRSSASGATRTIADLLANQLGQQARDINAELVAGGGGLAAGEQKAGLIAMPNLITGLNGGECSPKFSGTTNADTNPINIATTAVSGSTANVLTRKVAVCPPRY